AGQVDDVALRLIGNELVERRLRARGIHEPVVMTDQKATLHQAIIKEFDRLFSGFIQINVHVDECELAVCYLLKSRGNPALIEPCVRSRQVVLDDGAWCRELSCKPLVL